MADLPEPACVFPSFLFDPVWIAHDTGIPITTYCNRLEDFFAPSPPMTLSQFFPQSHAYHWHNQWNKPILPGTLAGHLYEDVCARCEREAA